jgi:hypothetical protein
MQTKFGPEPVHETEESEEEKAEDSSAAKYVTLASLVLGVIGLGTFMLRR